MNHDLPGNHRDSAGVIAPPPLLYVTALVIGLLLHRQYPIAIAPGGGAILQLAGIVSVVLGLMLSIAVMRWFRAAGTPVAPRRATTCLVVAGPYRYTRNPDYLGQTLVYVGIAIIADSWWPIFLLPLVLAMVQHGVIRREERYLEAKFGDAYRRYSASVRRWL